MGMELRIVTTEWDGILAGFLADKFDAIIGSMAIIGGAQQAGLLFPTLLCFRRPAFQRKPR